MGACMLRLRDTTEESWMIIARGKVSVGPPDYVIGDLAGNAARRPPTF